MRRVWSAALVGAARLRSQPGRTFLLLLGVAASTAMLVGVFGGSVIAKERALERSIDALPPGERSFRVDLIGLPAELRNDTSDHAARVALSQLTPAEPVRVTFFRDFWLDGEFVRLTALDELDGFVRLVSGRLPRTCRPAACEVLQIGGRGRPALHEGGINLVRVGIGELRDVAGLGPAFERLRQERAQASIVESIPLLAPSTAALERLPSLELLFRVRSWVEPLAATDLHAWDIDRTLSRESRAQELLQRADPSYVLVGPDAALLEARSRGAAYGERMVLVGGSAAALLLGFALVAAIGLRRGLATERRRLLQRGATRAQVWIALLTEVGTITVAGWLAGIAVGGLVLAGLAAILGLPAAGVLTHAVLQPRAIVALLVAWALASTVVVATVTAEGDRATKTRIRPLDVAALGAAVAVVIAVTRGALRTDAGASQGDRALLLLLPGLVCFAAAVAAARLLGPLMALVERLSRRRTLALRLALLALARAPTRTAAACAFLVVSVGLILFAASYRSTLERGARDQSAFSVPLDLTLSEGTTLAAPLDAGPLGRYERLAPGVRAYPVLRRGADLVGVGTAVQTATVVGVPARTLATMHWRSDFSPVSQDTLARELGQDASLQLRGPAIPAGAARVEVRVRLQGTPVRVDLVVKDVGDRIKIIPLGKATPGSSILVGRIPAGPSDATRRIIGLELSLPRGERDWFFHLAHERRDLGAPSGSLRLQPLTISSQAGKEWLADLRGWVIHGRGTTLRSAGRIAYSFPEDQTIVFRPRQPTDDRRIRVIASPLVARAAEPDGTLTLNFFDSTVDARVIATATRFPTLPQDEQFVIADETGLATAMDADAPGSGTPLELWLSVPDQAEYRLRQQLEQQPFAGFARMSRRDLSEQLVHDPLARAIGYTLLVTALLALALAVIGVWATLLGELRDERGDFFDLEGQGLGPDTLRWYLRLRTFVLLAFGAIGGLLLGAVLGRLVLSLVEISATATVPEPPLVFEPGWKAVGLTLAAFLVAAGLAAELSVRHAFRGETPERASWTLE